VSAMTVYLDEVFLQNLIIDYLLFITCCQISSVPIRRTRCFLVSCLGGIYAAAQYFPYFRFLYIVPIKMVVGVLLGYIVFRKHWKANMLFLLLGATFAGVLRSLPNTYRMNWLLLGLCAIGFYIILSLLFRHGLTTQERLVPASISLEKVTLQLTVLQDTGNMLLDYDGQPILVVSRRVFGQYDPFSDPAKDPCVQLHEQFPRRNVIFIPYSSIGGEGVLPAIQCDYLHISGMHLENVFIAICNQGFSGKYQGLWCGERSG